MAKGSRMEVMRFDKGEIGLTVGQVAQVASFTHMVSSVVVARGEDNTLAKNTPY